MKITALAGLAFLDRTDTQLELTSADGGHQVTVTLGAPLAAGGQGTVHNVASDTGGRDPNDVLVKEFNDKEAGQDEIENLNTVGELYASGEVDNITYALIKKQPGVPLKKTNTWKATKGGLAKQVLKDSTAAGLVGETQLEIAKEKKIIHKCVVSTPFTAVSHLCN